MTPEIQLTAVAGPKVRLLRGGSGSPLLFLHGAGGFPGWLPIFDRLAEKHEVIIAEHPGFGGSEDAAELRNVSDYAYYYLDFLDALGLPKVHVIGHSLGGWIASEIAVRDCSRFASLTLLAPAGLRVKGVQSGDNFIWSPAESVRNVFHNQALAEQVLARPMSDLEQEQAIRSRLVAARLGWEPRWFNPNLEKWLHRIKVSTLLVWGADDKLLPAAYAAPWKAGVPRIRSLIASECGHSPHVERADLVLPELSAFLQESDR